MTEKLLLIIESNLENSKGLASIFEAKKYKVHDLSTLEEVNSFKDFALYECILINVNINLESVEAFIKKAHSSHIPHIPICFLDTKKNYDKAILKECYEAGAADFIKKPFTKDELFFRVFSQMKSYHELSIYKLRVDKIGHLATIDQLSKLSSKIHMKVVLKNQICLYQRYEKPASILYLRLLDTQKSIGSFGLEYGDKLISAFSKELKKILRDSDIASRWEGHDFLIFLPETNEQGAVLLAKKINLALRSKEIMPALKPHMGFGVSELKKDDTLESLINNVRSALKLALTQNQNRIASC